MKKLFEQWFGTKEERAKKKRERERIAFQKRQAIGPFQIGDTVMVTRPIHSSSFFGEESVIPIGTKGMITDKNVTTTVYDIKHVPNLELTYGNKQRILLPLYTNQLKVLKPSSL